MLHREARNRQIYEAAARRWQFSGTCENCGGLIYVYGQRAYNAMTSVKRYGYACCSVSCGKTMSWKRKKEAQNETH